MATTVPMTNIAQYSTAASLVGSASAGMTTNKLSGCRPYTTPVPKVVSVNPLCAGY